MAQKNFPFTRGKNVSFKLFSDGNPHIIPGKNWNVEQNATEVVDDVNGEIRSRLDIITNYFSAAVDIFEADEDIMSMLMAQQANDDAYAAPLEQSCSLRVRHNDGTKAAYRLKGAVFGPWNRTMSGRTEANMINLKIRFTDWERVS